MTSIELSNKETQGILILFKFDRNRLLSGHTKGPIKLWEVIEEDNTTDLRLSQTFVGHTKDVSRLAKLSNNQFASHSRDGKVRIWDVVTGNCLQTLNAHSSDKVFMVELSGDLLAISGFSHRAPVFNIWDWPRRRCVYRNQAPGEINRFYELHKSEDLLIVYCYGHSWSVWHVDKKECNKIFERHCPNVYLYRITVISDSIFAMEHGRLVRYKLGYGGIIPSRLNRCQIEARFFIPINSTLVCLLAMIDGAFKCVLWDPRKKRYEVLHDYSLQQHPFPIDLAIEETIMFNRALITHHQNSIIVRLETISNIFEEFIAIRKSARMLSQVFRTNTGYIRKLPAELYEQLVGCVLDTKFLDKNLAKHIFETHFCLPGVDLPEITDKFDEGLKHLNQARQLLGEVFERIPDELFYKNVAKPLTRNGYDVEKVVEMVKEKNMENKRKLAGEVIVPAKKRRFEEDWEHEL